MRARLPAIAFRLFVLTAIWLLGSATFTFAQETGAPPASAPVETTTAETAPAETATAETVAPAEPAQPPAEEAGPAVEGGTAGPLVVPDVLGLPYVFAKGVLEDAGFAWKVTGKVDGYAVNIVSKQDVKAGTRVLDTGFPTIELTLEENPDYEERGVPENTSPYKGTELVLWKDAQEAATTEPATTEPATTEPATTEPAATEPAATEPAPATEPATTAPEEDGSASSGAGADAETIEVEQTSGETVPATSTDEAGETGWPAKRPPAFRVAGAPREPLDELPLPLRARRLLEGMRAAERPSDALYDHFLYQHAWVVAGAKFGWWHGEQALRILIRVDEEVQRRFGWSERSEAVARAALAQVLQKSKER